MLLPIITMIIIAIIRRHHHLYRQESHPWYIQINLPGWCWAEIQQIALIGSSSSLHSEACNALGASDGVIHSSISSEAACLRATANKPMLSIGLLVAIACSVFELLLSYIISYRLISSHLISSCRISYYLVSASRGLFSLFYILCYLILPYRYLFLSHLI